MGDAVDRLGMTHCQGGLIMNPPARCKYSDGIEISHSAWRERVHTEVGRQRLTILATFMLLFSRAVLFGGCCGAAPPLAQLVDTSGQHVYDGAKTTVGRPLVELLKAAPELRGLEPAQSQEELDEILDKVGANVDALLEGFPNLIAREDIDEERLDRKRSVTTRRLDPFSYMILAHESGEKVDLEEYRTDAKGNRTEPRQLERKFCLTTGFATMWIHFHPGNRPASRFKLLGRQELRGHKTDVVALAQRPGWATVVGKVESNGTSIVILYQGIAWIDVPSYQILRMRTDLLAPREDVGLERQTTEIEFGEVRLPEVSTPLWLPHEVVVTTASNGEILHNQHRYTSLNFHGTEFA